MCIIFLLLLDRDPQEARFSLMTALAPGGRQLRVCYMGAVLPLKKWRPRAKGNLAGNREEQLEEKRACGVTLFSDSHDDLWHCLTPSGFRCPGMTGPRTWWRRWFPGAPAFLVRVLG